MSPKVNFLQVGPGGICFAHGPYESQQCPEWPGCEVAILQEGPVPEYVAMAEEHLRQTNKLFTQADMDKRYKDGLFRAIEILNHISLSNEHGERDAWPAIREAIKSIEAEI